MYFSRSAKTSDSFTKKCYYKSNSPREKSQIPTASLSWKTRNKHFNVTFLCDMKRNRTLCDFNTFTRSVEIDLCCVIRISNIFLLVSLINL